jgi:hypothetical protein
MPVRCPPTYSEKCGFLKVYAKYMSALGLRFIHVLNIWKGAVLPPCTRCSGSVLWFRALVRFSGSVRWFGALVRFSGSVRWFGSLVRFSGSVLLLRPLIGLSSPPSNRLGLKPNPVA